MGPKLRTDHAANARPADSLLFAVVGHPQCRARKGDDTFGEFDQMTARAGGIRFEHQFASAEPARRGVRLRRARVLSKLDQSGWPRPAAPSVWNRRLGDAPQEEPESALPIHARNRGALGGHTRDQEAPPGGGLGLADRTCVPDRLITQSVGNGAEATHSSLAPRFNPEFPRRDDASAT